MSPAIAGAGLYLLLAAIVGLSAVSLMPRPRREERKT